MNQQHPLLWSGQQDEDSPEWTSQQAIAPYATDRLSLAELPEPGWSQLTANTNLVTSSSLDLHARETPICLPTATDTYGTASWGAMQHFQHPVEGMDLDQTQQTHFDNPLHQEFSGQTVRADAHEQDIFPRPEQMVDQYSRASDVVSYNHAAMGASSISDYGAHYMSHEDMPSTSYDFGHSQSFAPNTWHQIPDPQENLDSTYFNASLEWPVPIPTGSDDYQYDTLGLNQPTIESTSFQTSLFDAPVDQQLPTEYYGSSFHGGNTPLPFNALDHQFPTEHYGPSFYSSDTPLPLELAQSGGVMFPAGRSAIPTPVRFDAGGHIMTTPSAAQFPLEGANPVGYEASSAVLEPPHLAAQPPMLISDPPRTYGAPTRTGRKRDRTCDGSTDEDPRAALATTNLIRRTGSGMDNQDIYQNPSAEQKKKKATKRTHISVLDKAEWACFACWIYKGKVRVSCQHHV
jgi:hypothetical protein